MSGVLGTVNVGLDDRGHMMNDVVIRTVDPAIEPGVEVLLDLAFGGIAESMLVASLRKDAAAWIPELSLGAYAADGALVGYALCTRVLVGEERTAALSLAPVAVTPGAQKAGVGTALTRELIERARALGERAMIVLGHAGFYPRFGFVEASPLGISAPWDVPSDAWMALALSSGGLDGVRGMVRYPSAFDAAV